MNRRDEPRIIDLKAMIARRRRAESVARSDERPPSEPRPVGPGRRILGGAIIGLAVVVVMAVFYWNATEAGRALRALPAQDRAALYQRTMATLRDVCEPAPPRSLRAFCREQAALVLELRECDTECREIARRNLTVPTR
jgi:hypothetical protein